MTDCINLYFIFFLIKKLIKLLYSTFNFVPLAEKFWLQRTSQITIKKLILKKREGLELRKHNR